MDITHGISLTQFNKVTANKSIFSVFGTDQNISNTGGFVKVNKMCFGSKRRIVT